MEVLLRRHQAVKSEGTQNVREAILCLIGDSVSILTKMYVLDLTTPLKCYQ